MTVEFMRALIDVAGNKREATRVYNALADLVEEAGMGTHILDPEFQAASEEELALLPSDLPWDQRRTKIPESSLLRLSTDDGLTQLVLHSPGVRSRYIGGRNLLGKKGIKTARDALIQWDKSRV